MKPKINSRDYTHKGVCTKCQIISDLSTLTLSCLNCDIAHIIKIYEQSIIAEKCRADHWKMQYQELRYSNTKNNTLN